MRLRGLRKRFGYRETLRGVDLEVAPGACAVVFGPNGAGKSTMLRIIATEWKPSGGTAEIFGLDVVRDVLEVRRRVGVVFHRSFLRGELTLDENLRFAADLHGVRFGDDSVALIERLGLGPRRRDAVKTFSQGMTKRASIVRSLLHRPDLWLLDEPFSGLDPEGRDLFAAMVSDFRATGGTVILVTHQHELGRRLATDLWSVDAGRLSATEASPGADRDASGGGEP